MVLSRTKAMKGVKDRKPMKIAIASGKGGTGKTFLSTNLFYTLQKAGKAPVLLDCDAEEPNADIFFNGQLRYDSAISMTVPEIDTNRCTFCGRCSEFCAYNAIFIVPPVKVIRVLEELCHGCGACMVACNDGAVTEKSLPVGQISWYNLSGNASLVTTRMKVGVHSPVKVIREGIAAVSQENTVIMDAPPGTSCPFIQTVARADYVILVTEPTPFGLSDLKQAVAFLQQLHKPFGVVVNRAGVGDRAVFDYLHHENISLLMEIPFNKKIAELYAGGSLYATYDNSWQHELAAMYDKIASTYGNSHH